MKTKCLVVICHGRRNETPVRLRGLVTCRSTQVLGRGMSQDCLGEVVWTGPGESMVNCLIVYLRSMYLVKTADTDTDKHMNTYTHIHTQLICVNGRLLILRKGASTANKVQLIRSTVRQDCQHIPESTIALLYPV